MDHIGVRALGAISGVLAPDGGLLWSLGPIRLLVRSPAACWVGLCDRPTAEFVHLGAARIGVRTLWVSCPSCNRRILEFGQFCAIEACALAPIWGSDNFWLWKSYSSARKTKKNSSVQFGRNRVRSITNIWYMMSLKSDRAIKIFSVS